MKRREFLKTAGVGLAASTIAAPAIAQSMPEVKWRLTSSFPESLDTIYGAAQTFSKAVAEATDNRFQIQVFAANALVPGLQALDVVSNGTFEMCHSASYYYVGKDPSFAFGTAVPFGLNSRMQNAWMLIDGGMELMNDFYKKFNVHGIPCGNTGCQMGGWFRKEIKSPDDLKGLKMRIGGFAGRVMSKLGVVAQQLAGNDIYPSLEKGTIDAAEWVGPYDDEKLGFQQVAPFYYYPGWWEGGALLHNFINIEQWEKLPPAYKSIVQSCSEMAGTRMQAKYDSVNPQALERLLKARVNFKPFPASVMEASLKASLELYAEVGQANPTFKKMWDTLLAYRNEQYLWWQVAEYTYDTFLIRTRTQR